MSNTYPYENIPLPYKYNELEPYIDTETMRLHHNGQLRNYINNLNIILGRYPNLQNVPLDQLINYPLLRRMPEDDARMLREYAGGVYNHRLFFDSLAPDTGQIPGEALSEMIDTYYGNFDAFKDEMTRAANSVFGSGYTWFGVDRSGNLAITTTPNQNVPIDFCPILNLDVWEHSYYLKHKFRRNEYIQDWWNVINWEEVDRRLAECKV